MPAVRTYGIPRIIEAKEIFFFNGGKGKLPIVFSGGITDPKFNIPATYSTADPFEQIVIEHSAQFGNKVFRYGANGELLPSEPVEATIARVTNASKQGKANESSTKKAPAKIPAIDSSKVYPNVETIGQATEVLLDLGMRADELNGPDSVVSAMLKLQVSFPNLKFN